MKLFNVLSVTAFGVLFAVGCSSTDTTTTDGGTADTGTAPADTGTAPADTGSAEETSTDAGDTCNPCLMDKCSSEIAACAADSKCVAINDCVNACSDTDCANKCITDTPEGDKFSAIVTCGQDKCATECK
jgi:hypothetical protein